MQRLERLDGMDDSAIDQQLRKESFCRGCGESKARGLVVCWACFKYRDIGLNGHRDTLKYAEQWGIASGLRQWLKHVDRVWPRMALDTVHFPKSTRWNPPLHNAAAFTRVDYGDSPSDADCGL